MSGRENTYWRQKGEYTCFKSRKNGSARCMWCFHRSRRKWSCFVQPLPFFFSDKCHKNVIKVKRCAILKQNKKWFFPTFLSLWSYEHLQTKKMFLNITATFSDNHWFFYFYFIKITVWEMLSSAVTICFPWSKRSCRKYDRLKSMWGGSFSICWSHLKNIIHFPHGLISHCTLAEYWWCRTCILVTQTKHSLVLLCRH